MALCPVAGAVAQPSDQASRHRLVLLDGTTITGTIASIHSDGKIVVNDTENAVELNGLRTIERTTDSPGSKHEGNEGRRFVIELLGGGRLIAQGLTIGAERCRVQWQHGTISVPLDDVRAVRLQPQNRELDFEKALGSDEDLDRIFAQTDEKLVAIKGFIEVLDDQNVVFEWNEQQQTIPRAKLFGIVVALVGSVPDHAGQCFLELSDGSSAWGRIELLEAAAPDQLATLTFRLGGETGVRIPWDSVVRVSVRSNRLVYLSDLTPIEADEEPVVAFPRPWQRNRSVGRRHLTLGGRAFAKGIGVQARSRLVFNADGEFELLTATIGIDAETDGRGDCVFIVLGDGNELSRHRMTGADSPIDLRVDIQGVKEVTLLVEPGEDLDLGDHADWCDACFIRSSK